MEQTKDKTFLQTFLSVGTESCINSYVEHKHLRDKVKAVVENGANFNTVVAMYKHYGFDLINLNRFKIAVGFITIILESLIVIYLNKLPIFHENNSISFLVALIIIILPFALSMKLGSLQCKLLLNEFKKIDEINASEDLMEQEKNLRILQEKERKERLEKDKLACNLYLK